MSIGEEVVGIKENDEIYFDRHAGHKIPDREDQTYHVIKASDVVVVL